MVAEFLCPRSPMRSGLMISPASEGGATDAHVRAPWRTYFDALESAHAAAASAMPGGSRR
jgi:hypothetical protein